MAGKVIVGMSGGVDSSVAAYILKEQGYDVIGVTMQMWQEKTDSYGREDIGCGAASAVEDAKCVAGYLDIPHYIVDFEKEFKKYVVDYFVKEYQCGRTPNPCIACNRFVKWESLLHWSLQFGADYVATGHYAEIVRCANKRMTVKMSGTSGKDQTYALYALTQEQLARTMMPLGTRTKEETRSIARSIGLPVADKSDSQEICFIPDHDYAAFIERMTSGASSFPGNYVTKDNDVIGIHKGIAHYTVGQRKGLNLALGHPVFVTQIRPDTNEVVIGENEDLMTRELYFEHANFMALEELKEPMRMLVKIRYSHKGAMALVEQIDENKIKCTFDEPVRAVTPGQAAVCYQGEYLALGGIIM